MYLVADIVFNIARGAMKYHYYAVENSVVLATADQFTSTAEAALVIVPIETTGLQADGTLADYDDLAALLAASNNEQTTMGRKVLTEADLAAVPAPDDANDRLDLDLPDVTWTAATGNAISALLVCFDPDSTGGTDSSIVPLTKHDFVVTPDGSDVVAQINAAGFYRSS